jgi:hypothetical protein
MNFDLHFDEQTCRPLTHRGQSFLKSAHLASPSEPWSLFELYETATEEGLHVSFENSNIFNRLTLQEAV